ncbi:MAG TPA: response regulator [Devosia sp.]|jgi:CheY-like chemotaxis protein|nr:response regulator [Devosia sp.]
MNLPFGLTGKNVLVVEDESLVSFLTEDILIDAGCKVMLAMRLDEGLKLARGATLDLATLDVNLGGADTSYPIADVLAARRIPFMFVSGYGRNGLEASYRHHPVLQKPYSPQELLKAAALCELTAR